MMESSTVHAASVRIRILVASVLAVALVTVLMVSVMAKEVANQVNDPPPTDSYACGSTGLSLYQSFAPAAADLTSVVLHMKAGEKFPDAGVRLTIAVRIGSPTGSRIAASSTTVSGPRLAGSAVKARFGFTPPVRVSRGLRYVLEQTSPAAEGSDAADLVTWFGTSDNPYTRGTAFGCDAQPITDRDYNFVAYASAPVQPTARPTARSQPTETTSPTMTATVPVTPTVTVAATSTVTPTAAVTATATIPPTEILTSTPETPDPPAPTVTIEPTLTVAPTAAPTETTAPTVTLGPTETVAPSGTVTPTVGTPAPTQELSTVCPQIVGRVPQATIDNAVANPSTIVGYNELLRPNLPESRYNPRRLWLSMDTITKPYHPLFNGLVYKVGCP